MKIKITHSDFEFDREPFREEVDASGLPTLELPGAVLFPNETAALDAGRTGPSVRLVDPGGGRAELRPPFEPMLVKVRRRPDRDGDAPGKVCTLGRMKFCGEPRAGLQVRGLARVFADQGRGLAGRNPAHPVFSPLRDYSSVYSAFWLLISGSPGVDVDAGVAMLDKLAAIEQLGPGTELLPVDMAADFIAASLIRRIPGLDVPARLQQRWLEILDPHERLRALDAFMGGASGGATTPEKTYERTLLARKERCRELLKARKGERSFCRDFLEEKLKDAERQLNDSAAALRGKLATCGMPKEALAQLKPELDALSPDSHEKTNEYFRWLSNLPWPGGGSEPIDMERARRVLDDRLVGLREPKQRILEHLAVRRRTGGARGLSLCLVGPPGAGKTALAECIAAALGRPFAAAPCNGLNEIADVRGARHDYAASQPGQIIRQLHKAGARDPVFLLDEIDKVGKAAGEALIDALDPAQNARFRDLYVDVPFDLSEVFFVATANALDCIPAALRNRLEAVEVAGYSEAEKFEIAKRFVVPASVEAHGLADGVIEFEDEALRALVRDRAYEMGVRDLERGVSAICRRAALRLEEPGGRAPEKVVVTKSTVREVLGGGEGGEGGGEGLPGLERIRAIIERGGMPPEARRHAKAELEKMSSKWQGDTAYGDSFDYLRWVARLPWDKRDEERLDLRRAAARLDEGHAGLAKAKARILEHLAVRKLGGGKRTILCLAGPPGVGKTSLARDVAGALGLKFGSISCAGLSDGTELRGHNRTWRAAQPGRIVRELIRIGAKNPVLMLDEIDKISHVWNSGGDPESALLEILDPTQNDKFVDYYVEVPFDLSEVFFVATANVLDAISAPLRDRLEVIELPGYSEEEKFEIARAHLVRRQLAENGLDAQVRFTGGALRALIRGYTREAGVRNLERRIGAVCGKAARRLAEGGEPPAEITERTVADLLGPPPYADEAPSERMRRPGVAAGLSYTPAGGDVVFIEARRMRGEGALTLTGLLGDAMKESARAALSWMRANAARYGVDPGFYEAAEVHVHVPAGGVPKDGPSAGAAMAAALASDLTGRKVRGDCAMTGEITLSGDVLPVGRVKEKVLAARRLGIAEVILPKRNARDVEEHFAGGPPRGTAVRYASTIDELLALALEPPIAGGTDGGASGAPGPGAQAGGDGGSPGACRRGARPSAGSKRPGRGAGAPRMKGGRGAGAPGRRPARRRKPSDSTPGQRRRSGPSRWTTPNRTS